MESASAKTAEILIDGAWVRAGTALQRAVINPATLVPICSVPECSAEEVAAAAGAARRSLSGWASRSAVDRAALLEQAGREILRETAQLADLHARETGQVCCESLDAVRAAAAYFRKAAQSLAAGNASLSGSKALCGGCVAAVVISPEYPLLDWAHAASRLLALGSTLVCMPPLGSPLTILAAAACLDALPAGVINVLTVSEDVTHILNQIPGIDHVAAGRGAAHSTDAVFISETADLDLAVAGAASLRLFHSGQRRGQSTCIHVAQAIADPFTDRLHEFIAFLEAGDPCKRGTDLGPLTSLATLTRVEDAVGRALRQGARLKLGGRRYQPWGLPGYFFQPTILIDRSEHGSAGDDCIAGPVVILSPVRDIAVAISHGHRRGVRSVLALFARDPAVQLRAVEAAAPGVRTREPLRAVERICERIEQRVSGMDHLVVELIASRQPDWFPYHRRPPQPAGDT